MSEKRKPFKPEAFNEMGKEYLPGYLGITISRSGDGHITGHMPIKKQLFAPNEFLHAASIVALADTTCGCAAYANLPQGAESFTTIELKTNFLSTLREGVLTCVATPQHLGKTTQVWDALVTDDSSWKKVALFRCTQAILWPK